MKRVGINILLTGLLIAGLGGAGYVLPFVVPIDEAGVQLFETAVLISWGVGAALVVVGGVLAGVGKAVSHS